MLTFDGGRVATLRTQRHLSQRELGVRVGLDPTVAQPTVSAWERGQYLPRVNTLPLLAVVLECRISDFYTAAPTTIPSPVGPSTEETTPAGAV